MLPDHYAALGIAPGSRPAVIRAAYVELMRRYHPDMNPSAAAATRVRAITAAYSVIGLPERRASYDLKRANQLLAQCSMFADRPRRLTPFLAASFALAAIVLVAPLLIPARLIPPPRSHPSPGMRGDEPALLLQQDAVVPEWNVAAPRAADGTDINLSDDGLIVSPLPVIEQTSGQVIEAVDALASPENVARTEQAKVIGQMSPPAPPSEEAVAPAQATQPKPDLLPPHRPAHARRTARAAGTRQARALQQPPQPAWQQPLPTKKSSSAAAPSAAAFAAAQGVQPKPKPPQPAAQGRRTMRAAGTGRTPVPEHSPKPAWQRPLPPINPAWQRPLPPIEPGIATPIPPGED